MNSAENTPIDTAVFTVYLAAATMTALTGDYTKAGTYHISVTVKYTGAAYTNTFDFHLTGEIQDSCLHNDHWTGYRFLIDNNTIAARTHDLVF